ncbi:hypothetical protein LX99_02826 [Mucilaginibacter oryzae]|uniref:Uncharacterized protein n=1 Tax=Mucilaginibacter oryzae TaxID=468058 RepID=A0A316HD51_9SPHI|nr:hypothetical protein LX99_02826 [Mucilaginibacter oryzae]
MIYEVLYRFFVKLKAGLIFNYSLTSYSIAVAGAGVSALKSLNRVS